MDRAAHTEGVEIALEVASYIAHRLQHARVDREHLLAALLLDADVAHALSQQGIGLNALRRIVDAHLATRVPVLTYRTPAGELPGQTLDELLHRAARGRWFWRTVSTVPLMEEACADPGVAHLLARAKKEHADEEDLEAGRRMDRIELLRPVGAPADVALGILEEQLGKPPGEAKHLVLTATRHGRATVGTYDRPAAQEQALAVWAGCGPYAAALLFEIIPGTRLDPAADSLYHLETALASGEDLPIDDDLDVLTVEHVVWRLLQNEPFVSAIGTAGGSIAVVRERLEEYLLEIGSGDYRTTLRNAAYALLRSQITPFSVIERLPGDTVAACALDEAGVDLGALRRVLTGAAPMDSPEEGDGLEDVVMHDDDFTTKAFVVDVLRDVFDLSEESADAIMLRIHTEGQGIVGTYPAPEARARAADAERCARAANMPLRVSTAPHRETHA